MRITKNVIAETIANLMVGHPLRKRADNYMKTVAKTAMDLIEEHRKTHGFDSNDDVHTAVLTLKNMRKKYSEAFVKGYVLSDRVRKAPSIDAYYDLDFIVAVAGEVRKISLAGELDGKHYVSDIASPNMRKKLCKMADGTYTPQGRVSLLPGHWARDRLSDLDAERKAILEGYETLVSTVTAAMQQHTTAKKLVAAWPYIEPFLPKGGTSKTGTGVALNYETLNAICGLPK